MLSTLSVPYLFCSGLECSSVEFVELVSAYYDDATLITAYLQFVIITRLI